MSPTQNTGVKPPGESRGAPNYHGAGIVPVTMVDGKVHLLMSHPKFGKKAGIRWYDFGGKKSGPDEMPSDCGRS